MKSRWIVSLALMSGLFLPAIGRAQNWDEPSLFGNPNPPAQTAGYNNTGAGYFNPTSNQPGANPPQLNGNPGLAAPQGVPGYSPNMPSGNGYYSAPTVTAPNTYLGPGPQGAGSLPGYGVDNGCGCGVSGQNGCGNYSGNGMAGYGGGYQYGPSSGGYSGVPQYGCGGVGGTGSGYGYIGPAVNNGYGNVYSAACDPVSTQSANRKNLVFGLSGLVMFRNYGNNIGLSSNGAGQSLYTNDAYNSAMGGVEGFVQSRNCNGRGWEARYWGLFPNSVQATLSSPLYTALAGLSQIYHGPTTQTALDIFNLADTHIVARTNRFHNVEFNRLINAGTFCGIGGKTANYEFLHGARWFEFDEQLQYCAHSAIYDPMQLEYNINAFNTLVGYQLGGRSVSCLTERLQFTTGLRAGLYNNHIRHRQNIIDENGYISTINSGPSTGRPYDYSSNRNSISTLTEFDMGLGYLISCSCRVSLGYRLIGITGVATSQDQIPYNFTSAAEIQQINSNSSLILHGFYGGFNFCY